MIRTQISFQPELYEAARREARRQGISLAKLVRRAVAQLLARCGASSTLFAATS